MRASQGILRLRVGTTQAYSTTRFYNTRSAAHRNTNMAQQLSGLDLLKNQYQNKGTAFTLEERDRYNLHGYLPPKVETIEEQAARCYADLTQEGRTNLDKYRILADIQDENETLFFKVLLDHLEEFAPIVYTPTIGKVCQEYSKIYKRPRGLWLNPVHKGKIHDILKSLNRDIKLIVVTDNQRILGLGDLGAGGIGIPIGKINLYTAGAGIRPENVLPISLDVGCGKPEIISSDHYMGVPSSRLSGQEYNDFIEEFVQAVFKLWPNVLLQWEDFWKNNAIDILDRYRENYLSFNDDIQGTASVGVGGVLAAYRMLKKDLKSAKIVMLGAGAAGTGIMNLLEIALKEAGNPNPKENFMVLDSKGLVTLTRKGGYGGDTFKAQFCKSGEEVAKVFGQENVDKNINLEQVIETFKPDVLIGTSGVPNTFSQEAIQSMAKHCARPIIMPFSNPTSQCEAKPQDIIEWTKDQAVIATGSPFQPVTKSDGSKQRIGQGNNVFVFPGIGLGTIFAQASKIPDSILYAAAVALSESVSEADFSEGSCYPKISELRSVTVKVAKRVAEQCEKDGVAKKKLQHDTLERDIQNEMWVPKY